MASLKILTIASLKRNRPSHLGPQTHFHGQMQETLSIQVGRPNPFLRDKMYYNDHGRERASLENRIESGFRCFRQDKGNERKKMHKDYVVRKNSKEQDRETEEQENE